MKNVILVGFMGTGKTTIAKILASRLNMDYVSTDELIEKKEGMPISEIFGRRGEAYFRELEKQAVRTASGMENAVIDAGGGVVMDAENMENLRKKGVIISLWADPGAILERTKKQSTRPLLNIPDPLSKIKELLEMRKPFYENAEHHINTSGMSAEDAAGEAERIAKKCAKE